MTARFPLVLVNGYPQEIAATDRVANSTNLLRSPNQPANAVDGDLWMDTGNNTLKIYDGSGWAAVGGAGGGGSTVVSPTAPSTPTNGSLWYDTTHGILKVYLAATIEWGSRTTQLFCARFCTKQRFFRGRYLVQPASEHL